MKTRTISKKAIVLLAVMYLAVLWFGYKQKWQQELTSITPVSATDKNEIQDPVVAARFSTYSAANSSEMSAEEQKSTEQKVADIVRKTQNLQRFIENKGQLPTTVKYYTDARGLQLAISGKSIRFVATNETGEKDSDKDVQTHTVDLTFEGGNELQPQAVASNLITYNYMMSENDMHTNIQSYGELMIPNVYDGVDLRLYSNEEGSVEFDWLVSKPENFKKIQMKFNGQDYLKKTKEGGLAIGLRFQDVKLHIPESYQVIDGKKRNLDFSFTTDDSIAGFSLAENETLVPGAPLVIDPTITYATFFGSDPSVLTQMQAVCVAKDASGNVYAGINIILGLIKPAYINNAPGYSQTLLNTAINNNNVACIVKLAGNVCTGFTFFGSYTYISCLKLFPNGRVLFSGGITTNSAVATPMPTTAGAYIGNPRPVGTEYRGFVGVLSGDLTTLNYSSYLPGVYTTSSSQQGIAFLEIMDNETYFVAGNARSTSFTSYMPAGFISAGAPDVVGDNTYLEPFIARFSGAGYNVRDWATFVGGSSLDYLGGLKLTPDNSKLAFCGHTYSAAGWPAVSPTNVGSTLPGFVGMFMGTLNSGAAVPTSFSFLSFLGGVSQQATNPHMDVSNNFFYLLYNVGGGTIPGTAVAPAVYDATHNGALDYAISKVPLTGTASGIPVRSTFLGGSLPDYANIGIIANETLNKVYVVGSATSTDFPTMNVPGGAYFRSTHAGGSYDFTVSILSADLSQLLYSTYLGGNGPEQGYSDPTTGITSSNAQLIYDAANDEICGIGTSNPLFQGQGTAGHGPIFGPNSFDDHVDNGSNVPFIFNINGGGGTCLVAGNTPPNLTTNAIANNCPATTVNLNSLHVGPTPVGATLVWYTTADHSGAVFPTPTAAGAGTYYAFYYDPVSICFSPGSSVTVTINPCPCLAGSTAPNLSTNTTSNICPATTADLNALHIGPAPAGTTLVWFTNSTHTGAAYATPGTATAGIYYAFYFDAGNSCYSPASQVTVTINPCACLAGGVAPVLSGNNVSNICPSPTVDLNALVVGAPPAGTTLVWYTNNTHTGVAYPTPTAAGAGVYFAFYFDAVNTCYSPESAQVVVSINPCGSNFPDITPTIDIDNVTFAQNAGRDFVVNIYEILNQSTDPGQPLVFRINQPSGWDITVPGIVLNASQQAGIDGTSDVLGGTPNQNGLWLFSKSGPFILVTLQPALIIPGGSSMQVGFRATRKPGTPTFTFQNITATILNGSGGDNSNYNNSAVTTIGAGN